MAKKESNNKTPKVLIQWLGKRDADATMLIVDKIVQKETS
jgi:hypothetical protein